MRVFGDEPFKQDKNYNFFGVFPVNRHLNVHPLMAFKRILEADRYVIDLNLSEFSRRSGITYVVEPVSIRWIEWYNVNHRYHQIPVYLPDNDRQFNGMQSVIIRQNYHHDIFIAGCSNDIYRLLNFLRNNNIMR